MRIIAHRGASARAPENTLAAFALARRLGADEAELDARVCGSGEVVVFHDETLERLTGARGRVARTPLSRLRELRVRGEPIPTLEEAIRAEDRPPGLVVELKSDGWRDLRIACAAARVLRETRALERGPLVISSFNPFVLAALRIALPRARRAMLAEADGARPLRDLWLRPLAAPREAHLEARIIDRARVERARRKGLALVAWTVNDPAEARRLREAGAEGIITDVPDEIRAAVG